MSDSAPLRAAVDRLADRFRSLPQSRLRTVSAPGLELARRLSAAAQELERPGAAPRLVPDDGIFAVGDQIAVAGNDLLAALEEHPDRHDVLSDALRSVAAVADRL